MSACFEDWVCDEWSACAGGIQTRDCEDWNICGTEENKPAMQMECAPEATEPPAKTEELKQQEKEAPGYYQLRTDMEKTWLAEEMPAGAQYAYKEIGLVLIIGLVILLLYQKFKPVKYRKKSR